MNQKVRISHPRIIEFAGWTAPGATLESAGHVTAWKGAEQELPGLVACIADFNEVCSFNAIQIERHPEFGEFFPDTFRFEISHDGRVWEPILQESDFRAGNPQTASWNFPLTSARYLKFLFLQDQTLPSGKYFCAFGAFQVMVSGVVNIESSSNLDRLWVKDNLIDERPDYGWSTALRNKKQSEYVLLDLGSINRVSEIRLLTNQDQETLFPERFSFTYSEDDIAWHHLLEENAFLSEPGNWYLWRFVPTNMRYMRIDIDQGARTRDGKYVSQIIEVELFATPDSLDDPSQQQAEPIHHSSVLRAGIVRLGMDGEEREGVAVQGNDRRLRDASTEAFGIVELAADGEERGNVAVQGSDRRLKYATEDLPGIVRLARNGENRIAHVIQSDDDRLKYATEERAGLVELAENVENRSGVAVQGNDQRLKPATTSRAGIVVLAENNSRKPGEVVQGNDHRLREATTEYTGILAFARHGENRANAAVQASDPRLQAASAVNAGPIKLARDAENSAGKAVQGNDSRLAAASVESAGIVELALPGSVETGKVVQADDPRLADARTPLLHEHDYAPRDHDFNSHAGMLKIEAETGNKLQGTGEVSFTQAPIVGVNKGVGAGLVGRGKDGVIGSGQAAGVLGLSSGNGSGVVGLSRAAVGGHFVSERGYGLVSGVALADRGVTSSGLAFFAQGISRLSGSVFVGPGGGHAAVIASYWPVAGKDVLGSGDLVVINAKGTHVVQSREQACTGIIGVVVESAALVLDYPENMLPDAQSGKDIFTFDLPEGMQLVAMAGITKVRAIADRAITPGDMLMSSIRTGCVEKLKKEKYVPGAIVARALEGMRSGEGLLRVQLLVG